MKYSDFTKTLEALNSHTASKSNTGCVSLYISNQKIDSVVKMLNSELSKSSNIKDK
jgi:peptide subunit release factor 1 (eRF1)